MGHKQNTEESYNQLYQFVNQTFGVKKVPYRWSAQDPATLDQIPYIDRYSTEMENVFVATGYRKWGMSSGILAGQLLTNLISGRGSKYEETFSHLRPIKERGMKKLTKESFHVGKMFAEDKAENQPGSSRTCPVVASITIAASLDRTRRGGAIVLLKTADANSVWIITRIVETAPNFFIITHG